MADNKVITIARGYGSYGATMGRKLAEELGWNFYDRELLMLASADSGISESLFADADEAKRFSLLKRKSGVSALDGKVIPPDSSEFLSDENMFRYQAKIIRHLADTENCVIVGRCANIILADRPNVLRLYIHAPWDFCVRAVMARDSLTSEEAAKRITQIDKQRGDYYKHYTGKDWKDASNYDLCFDTARLGVDRCIAAVKSYLDTI